MEIDVRPLGEAARHPPLVAGALELLQPPEPDALGLFFAIVELDLRRSGLVDLFHIPTFRTERPGGCPPAGGYLV
jgi:hypothetical protein